jgi:NAD(P)-dependent dehydrogenase (short-subunit alcohol dehydrogenase family)
MIRTALVTGASSGIGQATAELLFQQGWNVVATMRQPATARAHPRWLSPALDVTDAASIDAALAAAQARFGRIHVLVNNAGYGLSGTFESIDPAQIARQFETNVFGLMRTCRAILPHYRQQGGGVIVNVASMGGRLCFPFYSVYHASKWAVEGFSESLQYEVEALGVRVKIIEPGAIRTDFYGRSAEVAHDRALSAYNESVDRVTARMKKVGANGAAPEQVARVILRAATDDSPKLRYPVGEDAKRLLGLRRWLGDQASYQAIKQRLMQ